MRGRLINPFLAELAQIDTTATAADPDGPGPLTSGYDPDFQEPVLLAPGVDARKEKAPVHLPCQVEVDKFESLQILAAGNAPSTSLALIFHFQDLERLALVDVNGDAAIRVNDRLIAIRRMNGSLVQAIRTPPGLFATEVEPLAFGLGGERNLLKVTFANRERAAR